MFHNYFSQISGLNLAGIFFYQKPALSWASVWRKIGGSPTNCRGGTCRLGRALHEPMQKVKVKIFSVPFYVVMKDKTCIKTVLCKNCVKFDPRPPCISFKYETLNFTHVKCAYMLNNVILFIS